MHIFVSFPLDDSANEDVILSNIRKGLGSVGKDCDLLTLPIIESESIDCLFDAEERVLALERLVEDVIRKYITSYTLINPAGITDTVVLGKSFDHFLKSFQWDSAKYPLSSRMSEILGSMEEEAMEAMDALKEKEAAYAEEKKRKEQITHSREDAQIYDVDIDAIEYSSDEEICAPFFKKYYIGVNEKLREKDIEALSEIDGLFIESRKLVKKCSDGEIYESLGRADIEEEIAKNIEECGFIVRKPQFTKEAYHQKKEKDEEIAQHIKEMESLFSEMIIGRLPRIHTLLLHVKHIGLYIESVLRYGLPSMFCVFILENKNMAKVMQKWKKLSASWKYSSRMSAGEKSSMSRSAESMYNFVYKTVGEFNLEKIDRE
ncbi:V-type H+-transporting ATPase subunit C [Nematocida minor]|uniref:V-type H+-transporting ATPase subunit C n=1 Tax=Nematocida minor TaxID=1912983 RepID=UPI00221F048E|nr:V-type H+-transporting ATPase subunit C [Nematocida minor]KAI5190269.1 V-type H+-transporting ATPase subunit C [Nematocida minor]